MPIQPEPATLETVLADFAETCPSPDARQLREWTTRHPEFAEDIVTLAALLIGGEVRAASASARRERTGADARVPPSPERSGAHTLADLLRRAGTDVPALEIRTGMRREVLAKLHAGLLAPPIEGRLVPRLAAALGTDAAAVRAAIMASAAAPMTIHAKAAGAPIVIRQSYPDALTTSGMSQRERDDWLAED